MRSFGVNKTSYTVSPKIKVVYDIEQDPKCMSWMKAADTAIANCRDKLRSPITKFQGTAVLEKLILTTMSRENYYLRSFGVSFGGESSKPIWMAILSGYPKNRKTGGIAFHFEFDAHNGQLESMGLPN